MITNTDRKVSASCNGVVTSFSFSFPIRDDEDIDVVIRDTTTGSETLLVNTTHYTVADVNGTWANGGTVSTVSSGAPYAYPSGKEIVIYRTTPRTQESEYETGKTLSMPALKANLDNLTMMVQELAEEIARCIHVPISDPITTLSMPSAEGRASSYFAFSATGVPTIVSTTPTAGFSYAYWNPTMTADDTVPYDAMVMIVVADPNGADRNMYADASFPEGSIILLRNKGPYAITFDPTGINYTLGAGEKAFFTFDGANWG